jgi:S1-C subfamily serine protease
VWNEQGHIVTNFHVIYGADAITVTLPDRTEYRARVVGLDPDHDIAVLQIRAPAEALPPITVGSSHDLHVGQHVLAIGNPFGLDHSLTTGVVSAVGRTIKSMTNRTIDGVIQTDAAINPGNSGGPLLDSSGRLIGINTQIMSPSGAYAGIGFAVPVDTVNRVVPHLIRYGKVIRPGLGVTFVPDQIAVRANVTGLIIARVVRGGPGEAAGLRGLREDRLGSIAVGDVLTRVDGKPVHTVDDLYTILDHHAVGDRVALEVLREGHAKQVTIELQPVE